MYPLLRMSIAPCIFQFNLWPECGVRVLYIEYIEVESKKGSLTYNSTREKSPLLSMESGGNIPGSRRLISFPDLTLSYSEKVRDLGTRLAVGRCKL